MVVRSVSRSLNLIIFTYFFGDIVLINIVSGLSRDFFLLFLGFGLVIFEFFEFFGELEFLSQSLIKASAQLLMVLNRYKQILSLKRLALNLYVRSITQLVV